MCNDKDYELCDEEKSFLKWLQCVEISPLDMTIIRKAYLDGYVAGWNNKQIYNVQEWLEK